VDMSSTVYTHEGGEWVTFIYMPTERDTQIDSSALTPLCVESNVVWAKGPSLPPTSDRLQ